MMFDEVGTNMVQNKPPFMGRMMEALVFKGRSDDKGFLLTEFWLKSCWLTRDGGRVQWSLQCYFVSTILSCFSS